ncbi:hypothetical protein [Candidatus Similichlamydia epinepheli]|uniref:hypothetical protein n=1 Tax=Candidatus Similichlamydia epinepheli TaxID=1903953 RepID=UPI000D3815EC|nr:hypothetical protein [Candidatus Similichlamydia epinepheli]
MTPVAAPFRYASRIFRRFACEFFPEILSPVGYACLSIWLLHQIAKESHASIDILRSRFSFLGNALNKISPYEQEIQRIALLGIACLLMTAISIPFIANHILLKAMIIFFSIIFFLIALLFHELEEEDPKTKKDAISLPHLYDWDNFWPDWSWPSTSQWKTRRFLDEDTVDHFVANSTSERYKHMTSDERENMMRECMHNFFSQEQKKRPYYSILERGNRKREKTNFKMKVCTKESVDPVQKHAQLPSTPLDEGFIQARGEIVRLLLKKKKKPSIPTPEQELAIKELLEKVDVPRESKVSILRIPRPKSKKTIQVEMHQAVSDDMSQPTRSRSERPGTPRRGQGPSISEEEFNQMGIEEIEEPTDENETQRLSQSDYMSDELFKELFNISDDED